jgi:hypothetical protein
MGGLYNFCQGPSSVQSVQASQVQHRSPAMAARVTDHIWTVREWLLRPVLGGRDKRRTLPTRSLQQQETPTDARVRGRQAWEKRGMVQQEADTTARKETL